MMRKGNPLWKWTRSSLVGQWTGWSWDYFLSENVTEKPSPTPLRIVGYMLDNIYERMRYLAGARWSQRIKKHDFVGIKVDRAIDKVLNGDW